MIERGRCPASKSHLQLRRLDEVEQPYRVYAYGNTRPRPAPVSVTKSSVFTTLTYDLNANMTAGLDGKVMRYDGQNRSLSVTLGVKKTCYVYAADGARLKKIEGITPAANCPTAPTAAQPVTAYCANVEIRTYSQGNAEQTAICPATSDRHCRSGFLNRLNPLPADRCPSPSHAARAGLRGWSGCGGWLRQGGRGQGRLRAGPGWHPTRS